MNFNNRYFRYTVWILLAASALFMVGQLGFVVDFLGTTFRITVIPILLASLFYYLLRPLVDYL
jgi:predicted PurR-regulated permease PerM